MWPGFPQRKNLTFDRERSCCLISVAFNCCEMLTCFRAFSVELLARSLDPRVGRHPLSVFVSLCLRSCLHNVGQVRRDQRLLERCAKVSMSFKFGVGL